MDISAIVCVINISFPLKHDMQLVIDIAIMPIRYTILSAGAIYHDAAAAMLS